MNILGISAFYHDSAAVLLQDGEVVAAAQEERFTRKKHDSSMPLNAVRYCLAQGGVSGGQLDAVVFYEKPIRKFERILKTYFSVAPRGLRSFMLAMPLWMREKLWIPMQIEAGLEECGLQGRAPCYFAGHHESHAASAFFPSPFEDAAILTMDGVGEWSTTTIGQGHGNRVELLRELAFPHSLGLLYSAFTYFTGFRVNSGEYKLMGLAPYGEPVYVQAIYDNLLDLKEDGSFRLNMDYFGYLGGLRMTNERFAALFGGSERRPEAAITQREMDLARSVQQVTEDIAMRMARTARALTGMRRLCLAGGVALNCVSNGKLLRDGPFDEIWIQPAAGDAGGALGAAYVGWHHVKNQPRRATDGVHDRMAGSFLGPSYTDDQIRTYLDQHAFPYREVRDGDWARTIAQLLVSEAIVGLFQGRMEFGPRALGARSILGDPRSRKMQSVMNLKIKHRESFRPFAPACLEEFAADYFQLDVPSPYMSLVAPIAPSRRYAVEPVDDIRERVNQVRSDIPAVTHVDWTARVQTVTAERNGRFYDLIKAFHDLTGCPLVVNTSFNVRGEPIVCTPEDAYRCFMRTDMDHLVLGSLLLNKGEQPPWQESKDWRDEFALD